MKKLLTLVLLTAMGSVASASTLYWQLNQEEASTLDNNWAYAVLRGTNGGTNKSGTDISAIDKGDLVADAVDAEVLDSYNSFYVELRDADNYSVGATDLVSASDLNAYTYAGGMAQPSASASPYMFNSFSAVPEPSGGLLVLIGIMAVGLKRKKV